MTQNLPLAPELAVSRWFNTSAPLTLPALRGKVVVLHAFQMLCPACVQTAIPQAQRIHRQFDANDVASIGLHTVFEHHSVMTPEALEVYIHENRLTFPIGVDRADGQSPLPLTMRAYGMQGTPTMILIDRLGRLRLHHFGNVEDMAIGAAIATLAAESADA